MTALYKVLGYDGGCVHGGAALFSWPLPVDGQPGEWVEVSDGPLVSCVNGLHLTTAPARWWRPRCRIFEAEVDGERLEVGGPDPKIVARRARLLREVDPEERRAIFREAVLVGIGRGDQ